MSELQGPRIPGEERSGRRRPLGWIIGGLLALLLLVLLIPFACQALRGGGADTQGQGQGPAGQQKAVAQEADDRQGGGGARDAEGAKNMGADGTGEDAQAEPTGGDRSQDGKETAAAEADGAAGSGVEDHGKTPIERAEAKTGGDLPETGGMSPAALLVVGGVLLLTGSTGLSAVVHRRSTYRG